MAKIYELSKGTFCPDSTDKIFFMIIQNEAAINFGVRIND
jgi:hypothetical protein